MDTFRNFLKQMEGQIPREAIISLPNLLSKDTQKRLLSLPPNFAAGIINESINEINHGSIETIEKLIQRRL